MNLQHRSGFIVDTLGSCPIRAQISASRCVVPVHGMADRSPTREPFAVLAPYWLLTCENFLCGFKAARPGRSRRRLGALRLRSRWRSRCGGASAGRLARKEEHRAAEDQSQSRPGPQAQEMAPAPSLSGSARTRQGRLRCRLRRRPLTEPARKSRRSQLSGAGTRLEP